MVIQRLSFSAHPSKDHPTYFEWQVADVCIFVLEENREAAFAKAMEKLRQERWRLLEFKGGSALVQERVRAQGGEAWKAYEEALRSGVFFIAVVDSVMGDKQNSFLPRVPRITEKFIDKVVERAGGRRPTAAECNNYATPNVDYLIDGHVFDLKILEEEGLEHETRQAKLADLFKRPVGPYSTIELNPQELSELDRLRYNDIIGGSLQNAIRSASGQVRSTKTHLKQPNLRGGVIVVNTGYGTLHPDLLLSLTHRYAAKYDNEVQDVIAISSWLVPGKAFEATIYFECEPKDSADPVLNKFNRAFWECIDEFMTNYMRAGMNVPGRPIDALKPITFEKYGIVFAAVPNSP